MSLITRLRTVDEKAKEKAVETLVSESTPDFDFFLLVVIATVTASFGLLINSAAVVIGSMLLAPILYPVLSISLGVAISDGPLIGRSISTLIKASALGVGSSALVALLFGDGSLNFEILSRTDPSLIYFAIALLAGFAVVYTLVKPELSATLPGVVVSVALLPPLAVIGVGLAYAEWTVIIGSLVLFVINIGGIFFASLATLSLMSVYRKKKLVDATLKEENHRVEEEKKEIKKVEEQDKKELTEKA